MSSRFEKCQICQSSLSSKGDNCGFCGSPFIFAEYYLDVTERALYKARLNDYRKNWEELKESLKKRIVWDKDKWSSSSYWADIWRQIRSDAKSLQLSEPAVIKLAEALSNEPENGIESAEINIVSVNKMPRTPVEKVQERVIEWVGNQTGAEYDVIEWVNFTASLGNIVGFDDLGNMRDAEFKRQFITFKTESVFDSGETYNVRVETARRFVEVLEGGIDITMIRIPGGEFEMGDDSWNHTKPRRRVSVADFYIGMIPVTQLQWFAVSHLPAVDLELKENPSHFRGDSFPVNSVSWKEAVEFCKRLSNSTKRKYRLPSEAEWEYAARAGSTGKFAFGEILKPSLANYTTDAAESASYENRKGVIPAGVLTANAFGLYDMHGNVWEWCADAWHPDYIGAPENSRAWKEGGVVGKRVLRGGAWCNWADLCRSGERIAENENKDGKLYYTSFRLALDL